MELMKVMRSRVRGFREVLAFDNRWELMLHRLLFRETGMVTYRKGALEFVVDHAGGDAPGTRACLVTDMYRALLPHMDLHGRAISVLDIGANGGGFPLMLLDEGLCVGRYAAVEMNPRTFSRLQLNVVQNMDGETTLIHGAVCGQAQRLQLQLGRGSTGESMYGSAGNEEGSRTVTVDGLTFDQIVERAFGQAGTIDLCKIDVEGAEYDVFAHPESCGALRRVRYLIIEIHQTGKDAGEVHRALGALGFSAILQEHQTAEDVFCFENHGLA